MDINIQNLLINPKTNNITQSLSLFGPLIIALLTIWAANNRWKHDSLQKKKVDLILKTIEHIIDVGSDISTLIENQKTNKKAEIKDCYVKNIENLTQASKELQIVLHLDEKLKPLNAEFTNFYFENLKFRDFFIALADKAESRKVEELDLLQLHWDIPQSEKTDKHGNKIDYSINCNEIISELKKYHDYLFETNRKISKIIEIQSFEQKFKNLFLKLPKHRKATK